MRGTVRRSSDVVVETGAAASVTAEECFSPSPAKQWSVLSNCYRVARGVPSTPGTQSCQCAISCQAGLFYVPEETVCRPAGGMHKDGRDRNVGDGSVVYSVNQQTISDTVRQASSTDLAAGEHLRGELSHNRELDMKTGHTAETAERSEEGCEKKRQKL